MNILFPQQQHNRGLQTLYVIDVCFLWEQNANTPERYANGSAIWDKYYVTIPSKVLVRDIHVQIFETGKLIGLSQKRPL